MSDDYLKDEDLLSILEESAEESEKEMKKSKQVKSEVEEAFLSEPTVDTAVSISDLKDITEKFTQGNAGSGDIDIDLSNWFDGVDALPSESLNNAVANSLVKLDYGLTHNTLTSFKLMSKLRKFIEEDAFDLLFSEAAILGLDSEEILDRVKVAFTMYKEMGNLTQRVVQSQRDFRLKSGGENTEVDRLTMLLSTIPSDKLESTLKEISFSHDKKVQ